MSSHLLDISKNLLTSSLNVQTHEQILIVCDPEKRELADAVYQAATELASEAILMEMKCRAKSGEEPPRAVSEAMKQVDVAVCITTESLTHTKARKEAAALGVRVATMPGITEDLFSQGAITADYGEVKDLTEKVTKLLRDGKKVRITKDGKEITFSVEGRNGIPSTGVYRNKGESGNLPSGEAYIAPIEGSANGEITVDGSIAGIGKVTEPLKIRVENGRLVEAMGEQGQQLLTMLGDKAGRELGEFGIGTNEWARITGVVLEDEKVAGTIHLAFGSNHTFGGTVDAGVHIDLVITKPSIWIDEKLVMEDGEFCF
ncbi:aminopeptidase [Risungbinella massiliensis]|uniref:aminopeptidase n=1 Tax=Risungbinella massiliensis TaxID=1329796 RepID=UPI0005CBF713|nr:aminopeptidase [Risungbinella massiliensis]